MSNHEWIKLGNPYRSDKRGRVLVTCKCLRCECLTINDYYSEDPPSSFQPMDLYKSPYGLLDVETCDGAIMVSLILS